MHLVVYVSHVSKGVEEFSHVLMEVQNLVHGHVRKGQCNDQEENLSALVDARFDKTAGICQYGGHG